MIDSYGATVRELEQAVRRHLRYSLARDAATARAADVFPAVALAVRDRLIDGMFATEQRFEAAGAKRLYYLSMEFLMGRALGNTLCNLGLLDACREALGRMGVDLDEVRASERDAGLGNGGLGRLAACFLDSLASLGLPGYGYGINYEYGLFRQTIDRGEQREEPDNWQATPSPWLIERPEDACLVPIYGHVDHGTDRDGNHNPMWLGWKLLIGVPHDMPIVGYGGRTVNYLRLYSARASDEFDMRIFNLGDYLSAVQEKMVSETVSRVLYPSDAFEAGRELRLVQEYFFVACAVRDVLRRHLARRPDPRHLSSSVAIQLNDTHPAIAVAELMRALVDEHGFEWEEAWEVTRSTLGYTNHTLLPEALERWPVDLFARVLPRHLEIIFEVNRRFLEQVSASYPGDAARLGRMSIIEEGPSRQVRMAHLAIVGSHSVNGVSALHSRLVQTSLVPDFHELWPERFNNKTNGVTPRRWLLKANPGLAGLLSETIGDGWITDLDQLRRLEPHVGDPAFRDRFRAVKRANKEALAAVIRDAARVAVDHDSMFDVQAKRIHEYKRQLLFLLGVVDSYLALVEDGMTPAAPRTCIFAGKAAPGYWVAKEIIRLVHDVARVVNGDGRARDWLRVVFLPDYRVSLAERIIPAADLSEQISTAGKEASGTGNMKFALNGALTMGTLDGANVEMGEEVGWDNIYIFGLRAEQVAALHGRYRPRDHYENEPRLRRVLDAVGEGRFSPEDRGRYRWLFDSLLDRDEYFHLADFAAYVDAQGRAAREYLDPDLWFTKAALNTARMGRFSSDRTIREYAEQIWGLDQGGRSAQHPRRSAGRG